MININNNNKPLNYQSYTKKLDEIENEVQQLQQALGIIASQTLPAVEQNLSGLNEIAAGQNGQVNANKQNIEQLTLSLSVLVDELQAGLETNEISVSDAVNGKDANFTGKINAGDLETGNLSSGTINAESVNTVGLKADGLIEAEEINTEILTAGEINASSFNIESINSNEFYSEKLNADNATVENVVAGWTSSGGVSSNRYTWRSSDNWQNITGTAGNDKLLKIKIPFYEGIINLLTQDGIFNISVINNSLVSFNQSSSFIYRIDLNDNGVDVFVDIGSRGLSYAWITIGENANLSITSEMVDRTSIQPTIRTLRGTLGNIVQMNEELSVFVTDNLPTEGVNNTIYIVRGDRSYYYNGLFVPLSSGAETILSEVIDFSKIVTLP